MNKEGVITQLIGAVVDVKFKDELPEIYTALETNNGGNKLILEVAQHLGENSVRTIACLLYTSPSPRDVEESRMPSSA